MSKTMVTFFLGKLRLGLTMLLSFMRNSSTDSLFVLLANVNTGFES